MRQVAGGRTRVGSLWAWLALGFSSAMVCLAVPAAAREVNLYWTDTGIGPGQRPGCLDHAAESMFRPFGDSVTPFFAEINPERGTILIPMPRSEDRPKTDAEWSALAERLYQGMRDRVQQGLRDSVSNFEIRTVQDTGSLGNLAAANPGTPTGQPAQCVRFTEAFLTALDKLKQDLARTEQVHAYGLVSRDGGYVATESIAALRRSPLDHLVVVDGTAHVDRAVQTSAVMNGHLTLINTAGDAPASPNLVANLKGSQEARRRDPRIRLAHVDTQVSAPAATDLPRTTLGDVIRQVLAAGVGNPVGVIIPYGVAMDMKVVPGSFKEGKPGELDQLRKETLKSRPPQGGVTWPVPEKGGGK